MSEIDGVDGSLDMALDDLEAAEKRIANLELQLAGARLALSVVKDALAAERASR